MTLGEIKIESLRLMNVTDDALSVENLNPYYIDEAFKDYLERMDGAINRALSRFAIYKVIPTKTEDLTPSQGETKKQFLQFDLKKLLSDFDSLERIIYIYERVIPNIDYQTITDGIVLIPYSSSYIYKGVADKFPTKDSVGVAYNVDGICKYYDGNEWVEVDEDETFKVEYVPKLPTSTRFNTDEELDLPDALVRIIPYFVKAELYENEEPNVSANARNIFESALSEYVSLGATRKNRQGYVKNEMW